MQKILGAYFEVLLTLARICFKHNVVLGHLIVQFCVAYSALQLLNIELQHCQSKKSQLTNQLLSIRHCNRYLSQFNIFKQTFQTNIWLTADVFGNSKRVNWSWYQMSVILVVKFRLDLISQLRMWSSFWLAVCISDWFFSIWSLCLCWFSEMALDKCKLVFKKVPLYAKEMRKSVFYVMFYKFWSLCSVKLNPILFFCGIY